MLKEYSFKRITAVLLSFSLIGLNLHSTVAQAAMVSTGTQIQQLDSQARQAYDREQLLQFARSEQASQTLQDLGVNPADVEARVANMTADELAAFNSHIGEMPAGGISLVGVVVLVFAVLITLDLLGTTNIFPVIKPVGSKR